MPRLKRRARFERPFGPERIPQLKFGLDFFGDGWGDRFCDHNPDAHHVGARGGKVCCLPVEIEAEMSAAWEELGPQIMATWNQPGRRPWGWWMFDSPEARDESIPEGEQLQRMGGSSCHP